jgi:nitrogen fixation protein NifU and related proteins
VFDDLTQLYQQAVLDHSKHPRNFRTLPDATRFAEGKNPLCGDRFSVFIKLEQDTLADIAFQGSGCAISKAAASAMTEALKGRSSSAAQALFKEYQSMILSGTIPDSIVEPLRVFGVVNKFPARIKCALLPWRAAIAAIEGTKQTVSTEDRL